jgi:hypothetical protein
MEYIETVKWRIYNYDRESYAPFSKTHIFDVANKTLCGVNIPIDAVFRSHLLQPATCKRCLAKHEAA